MDKGPVIPSPAATDAFRSAEDKIAAAKIRAARRRIARRRLARIDPVDRSRPDGLEMRKLAAFSEEYKRGIEKYAEGLKQSQTEWQKEAGKLIHDILKVGDNAVELYEAFQEYPFSDNFKDYGADKAKAANKRDYNIALLNQAIALYYWSNLKEIDESKIIDKPEFKEAEHFIDTLKVKMRDRADMDRAATECKRQAELAQFQSRLTDKRGQEATEHSEYIGNLPNNIGYATLAKRYLKAGYVEEYAKKADKQVTELENVLAHVEKHWQETEAKMGVYRSKVEKRRRAVNDLAAQSNEVNQILTEFSVRATQAGTRTTDVRTRQMANPIGDTTYRSIADRIIVGATSVADNVNIASLGLESRRARARVRLARTRAEQAETRAEQAETRARQAEMRARIAKAYNNPVISDGAAKKILEFSKNSEEMEKKVADNACLISLNEKNIQFAFTDIENKIREMQNITAAAGGAALTVGQLNDLQRLAGEIEKAEIAKNSSIAFDLEATLGEQTVLGDIINELQNESLALTSENPTATAIANLANQDLPHLQNLVNRQKDLVDILKKGTPATATTPARRGLIELAKARAEVCHTLASTIKGGGPAAAPATILRHQWDEANYRREFVTQIGRFSLALQAVRPLEENAAPVLKRNAIHMERDIADDANKAIKPLQEIKNNLADQDDEGLKKLSKGHLFIDPKAGKFTVGHQAVWMWVKEINGWGRPDYATVPTGQTLAEFQARYCQDRDRDRHSRSGEVERRANRYEATLETLL